MEAREDGLVPWQQPMAARGGDRRRPRGFWPPRAFRGCVCGRGGGGDEASSERGRLENQDPVSPTAFRGERTRMSHGRISII